jgi:hypothetical protein
LLGENVITIKRNTEIVLIAGKATGLDVNAEKPTAIFMSREQNSGLNHTIKKIANRSFENVAKFKYLRATLTNRI